MNPALKLYLDKLHAETRAQYAEIHKQLQLQEALFSKFDTGASTPQPAHSPVVASEGGLSIDAADAAVLPEVSSSTTKALEVLPDASLDSIDPMPVTCSTDCSNQVVATAVCSEPAVDLNDHEVEQLTPARTTPSIGTSASSITEEVVPSVEATTDVNPKAGVQELDALPLFSINTSTAVTSEAYHIVVPSDLAAPMLAMCSTRPMPWPSLVCSHELHLKHAGLLSQVTSIMKHFSGDLNFLRESLRCLPSVQLHEVHRSGLILLSFRDEDFIPVCCCELIPREEPFLCLPGTELLPVRPPVRATSNATQLSRAIHWEQVTYKGLQFSPCYLVQPQEDGERFIHYETAYGLYLEMLAVVSKMWKSHHCWVSHLYLVQGHHLLLGGFCSTPSHTFHVSIKCWFEQQSERTCSLLVAVKIPLHPMHMRIFRELYLPDGPGSPLWPPNSQENSGKAVRKQISCSGTLTTNSGCLIHLKLCTIKLTGSEGTQRRQVNCGSLQTYACYIVQLLKGTNCWETQAILREPWNRYHSSFYWESLVGHIQWHNILLATALAFSRVHKEVLQIVEEFWEPIPKFTVENKGSHNSVVSVRIPLVHSTGSNGCSLGNILVLPWRSQGLLVEHLQEEIPSCTILVLNWLGSSAGYKSCSCSPDSKYTVVVQFLALIKDIIDNVFKREVQPTAVESRGYKSNSCLSFLINLVESEKCIVMVSYGIKTGLPPLCVSTSRALVLSLYEWLLFPCTDFLIGKFSAFPNSCSVTTSGNFSHRHFFDEFEQLWPTETNGEIFGQRGYAPLSSVFRPHWDPGDEQWNSEGISEHYADLLALLACLMVQHIRSRQSRCNVNLTLLTAPALYRPPMLGSTSSATSGSLRTSTGSRLGEQQLSFPELDANTCRPEHIHAAIEEDQRWNSLCCDCSCDLTKASVVVWVEYPADEVHKLMDPTMTAFDLQPPKILISFVISKKAQAVSGMTSSTGYNQDLFQGGRGIIIVAAFFAQDFVSLEYYICFDCDCADNGHVLDYHRDSDNVQEHREHWDPGGSQWCRLGDKPTFKKGGMLGAYCNPDLYMGLFLRPAHGPGLGTPPRTKLVQVPALEATKKGSA